MTVNNIARNQMSEAMMRVASGQRVNSARDDAAGAAIIEEMTAQVRGLDQGTRNTLDMQALVNTAEGGLDSVSGSLQRVRELSIQAANDTTSPAQREMINAEIQQLADHIGDQVNNVQFNTMNLLDGSREGFHTASGPDGQGMTVRIDDMTSIAQAVADINVTGRFDHAQVLDRIDSAIRDVAGARATLGAQANRLDYTASANTITSINLADARSRIADADIPREMAAVNQERVINEMQVLLQRQRQDDTERETEVVRPPGAAGVQ